MMIYPKCSTCLYSSNHPFGLTFDEAGICSGCNVHQEKYLNIWDGQFEKLKRLTKKHKAKNGSYDCIVPVRGTPEYFYVLDVVKNKLGLNPLVVVYNSHFNSSVGIKNLDLLKYTFDVDVYHYSTNLNTYKKIIRESLVSLRSMRYPYIAGETQFPVLTSVEKKIPLIIWPYNQQTEQVGMHSYVEECQMSRRARHDFDLMGTEPEGLCGISSLLTEGEVEDIIYPPYQKLSNTGTVGIYLSNFLPWDTRAFSEEMVEKYGAHCANNFRTFDTYDRIDDLTYMSVHDILKFAKIGYSRVTDNLVREIRFGRISKERALRIEKFYQTQYPKEMIDYFLSWLGMSEQGFKWILERLPFGAVLAKEGNKFELNDDELLYISGYQRNSALTEDGQFITIGKGAYV